MESVHALAYKVGRHRNRSDVVTPFEERDDDNRGVLSERSFVRALEFMDCGLTEKEIETVVNFLKTPSGLIDYQVHIHLLLVHDLSVPLDSNISLC